MKKDSVVYKVIPRDTVIYLPKYEAVIDGVDVEVDSAGKAQLSPVKVTSGKANVEVSIKDGKLQAIGSCKEDSLRLVILDKEKEIYNLENSKQEKKEVQVTNKVPDVFKWLSLIGVLSIIYIAYRVIKIFSL